MTSYFHLVVRHMQLTSKGNKNMKSVIFTGATSIRSKNIFTDISRCPTGKQEIKIIILRKYSDIGIHAILTSHKGFFFQCIKAFTYIN